MQFSFYISFLFYRILAFGKSINFYFILILNFVIRKTYYYKKIYYAHEFNLKSRNLHKFWNILSWKILFLRRNQSITRCIRKDEIPWNRNAFPTATFSCCTLKYICILSRSYSFTKFDVYPWSKANNMHI